MIGCFRTVEDVRNYLEDGIHESTYNGKNGRNIPMVSSFKSGNQRYHGVIRFDDGSFDTVRSDQHYQVKRFRNVFLDHKSLKKLGIIENTDRAMSTDEQEHFVSMFENDAEPIKVQFTVTGSPEKTQLAKQVCEAMGLQVS